MPSDQENVWPLLVLAVILLGLLIKKIEKLPDENQLDKELIDNPLLPTFSLAGYGIKKKGFEVGYFDSGSFEPPLGMPLKMELSGFEFKMNTSLDQIGVPNFLIYGWTIRSKEFQKENYYGDPLLHDKKGTQHVLVG